MHYNALQTSIACSSLISSTSPPHAEYVGLIESNRLAHSRLDMQRFDVLPIFLQERNEEIYAFTNLNGQRCPNKFNSIHTQHNIGEYLIICHLNMANSNTQAKDLLKLEFYSGAYFRELSREILRVRDGSRELSSYERRLKDVRSEKVGCGTFRKSRTQKARNLLDQSFGSKESIVFLGEFLHKLLVFVQSLRRM